MEEDVGVSESLPLPAPLTSDMHPPSEMNEQANEESAAASSVKDAVPSDPKSEPFEDLRDMIVRQVEYYFSDENLPTDQYLRALMKKNKEGFVPIAVIASFRKMKKLTQVYSVIEAALKTSSQLIVSPDGKKVKRLHPLPDIKNGDDKPHAVLVENLPEDYSKENIRRIFGEVGNIRSVCINDQCTSQESKDAKKMKAISSKLHAVVEYETVEAAQKAVATLNNDSNWRNGMRVRLLLKRRQYAYKLAPKGQNVSASVENMDIPAKEETGGCENDSKSVEHSDEMPNEEVEHLAGNREGRRGRYRMRREHQEQNSQGDWRVKQGHGSVPNPSTDTTFKPPPGPRMPDGTRGFTMGRGKPLSDQN